MSMKMDTAAWIPAASFDVQIGIKMANDMTRAAAMIFKGPCILSCAAFTHFAILSTLKAMKINGMDTAKPIDTIRKKSVNLER